jgi:hypothetical protein
MSGGTGFRQQKPTRYFKTIQSSCSIKRTTPKNERCSRLDERRSITRRGLHGAAGKDPRRYGLSDEAAAGGDLFPGKTNFRNARRPKTVKPPKFRPEGEEAKWWDGHPGCIADQFEKAAKEGRIWQGLPGHGGTRSVTIRLATKDLEIAQALAGKAGMPYQTYIKSVLHRALERERKAG